MRQQLAISAAVLLVAGMTAACKPAGETARQETAAVAPPRVVESKGALAARREAQEHFDKARESFMRKDLTTAATELRAGSTFLREQADSVTGEVKEHMLRSARELDQLAAAVEKNSVESAKKLDLAFARAQYAEADRHHSNAVAAWAKKENGRAGDELTMAIDHLERAAKDAGEDLDAGTKKVLADTREVAGQLMKGAEFVPEKVGNVIEALGKEVRTLGTKIERETS